jgi:hypothetical protein
MDLEKLNEKLNSNLEFTVFILVNELLDNVEKMSKTGNLDKKFKYSYIIKNLSQTLESFLNIGNIISEELADEDIWDEFEDEFEDEE